MPRARPLVLAITLAACSSAPSPDGGPIAGAGGFPGGSGGGPAEACDADADGWDGPACGGADCDDADAAVYPGAPEACDGVDQGCDGVADEGCGCTPGDLQACWSGPERARDVGACRDGVRRCGADRTWGPCEGETLPVQDDSACDGVDADCDGLDAPDCSRCPEGAVEICGNGLDDDCDRVIDDPELCTLDCSAVNPRDPATPGYICCAASPPNATSYSCADGAGMPDCASAERTCLDLDGDPVTACAKACDARGCVCGRPDPSGKPVAVPDCGFLTACSRVDCDGKRDQPCYSGPPATLGVGVCHGGRASCGVDELGRKAWGVCEGEVLPGREVCGNGADDDCDGLVDEADGVTGRRCATATACAPDAEEICGNGLDDDCDGFADEACAAPAGSSQACWTGSLATREQGACRDGVQHEAGGAWGPCVGQVLPAPESCGDAVDADCDGLGGPGQEEDGACCVPSTETCNGTDDDCDGLADEGVISRCGLCGGSCYAYEPASMSDCREPGRTCERVGPSALSSSAITLEPGPAPGGTDLLAFTQGDFLENSTLVLLDTIAMTDTASVDLSFEAGDLRMGPDGTVWVSESSFTTGQVLHLDRTGRVLCRADSGPAFQIAVDSSGDLWVTSGSFQRYELAKFSGTQTVPVQDAEPRCKVIDLAPDDPEETRIPVRSTAAPVEDENRYLWLMGPDIARIDLLGARPELEQLGAAGPAFASDATIGSDGGLYLPSPVRRYDLGQIGAGAAAASWTFGDSSDVEAIDAGLDGSIWGVDTPFFDPPSIVQFDLASGEPVRTVPVPSEPFSFSFFHGIAVDRPGRIWVNEGDSLFVHDLGKDGWTQLRRGAEPRIFAGSTDASFTRLARSRGRWSQILDAGSFDVRWTTLEWCAAAPAGSRVVAIARFADDPAELGRTPHTCGPYAVSPADLSSCSQGRRYAQVEFLLSGHGKPAVDCLRLAWDRK